MVPRPFRRLPLLVAALLPVTLAVAGGVTTVSQQNRAFQTRQVALARGDVVHFTNDDQFIHQIYVDSPTFTFESDEQSPGESVDLRFPSAGSFTVRCHIHPKMQLQVDVR